MKDKQVSLFPHSSRGEDDILEIHCFTCRLGQWYSDERFDHSAYCKHVEYMIRKLLAEKAERLRMHPNYLDTMEGTPRSPRRLATTAYRSDSNIRTLLKRDGDTCKLCGSLFTNAFDGSEVHIDHITPISRGGSNDISNLQLLHAQCNNKKHARSMEEILYLWL